MQVFNLRLGSCARHPKYPAPIAVLFGCILSLAGCGEKPAEQAEETPISESLGTGRSRRLSEIASELEVEFAGLAKGGEAADRKFLNRWKEAGASTELHQPLAEAQWLKLPEKIRNLCLDPEAVGRVLSRDAKMPLHEDVYFDAFATRLHLAMACTTTGLADLPSALAERMDALPATVEDLVNLIVVRAALRELSSQGPAAVGIEQWLPLATAKNPLYRHLALFGLPRSAASDPNGRSPSEARSSEQALSAYLKEGDPLVVAQGIRAIGSLGTPSAADLLDRWHRENPNAHTDLIVQELGNCRAIIQSR